MPNGPRPTATARSASELVRHLADGGPAVVALSGGVDSAVVASLAHAALGSRALAVTVVGSAVASDELDAAAAVARHIGLRHETVVADPLADPRYRQNGHDRCYYCRRVETGAVREIAAAQGATQLLDGVHADDLAEDRPGIRAMDEAGFTHPLLWAGWDKPAVRRYATEAALPNSARPSNACLASRVARGDPISAELLGRIDRAERFVRAQGFRRVRVRVRGTAARVEVDPSEVHRLEEPLLSATVAEHLQALGFSSVSLDPRGYLSREALPVVR